MLTIKQWLASLGLQRYGAVFEANDIDLDILSTLTEEDFALLGVSFGDRKRLLRAIPAIDATQRSGVPQAGSSHGVQADPIIESVTAEGERRQVTVLFSDLVASSALAVGRDPEEYRSLLSHYHQVCVQAIQRYDGFVAQIQGDGVLAYFGYPLAHEGEVDRALHAAFGIVDEIGRLEGGLQLLQVRVGVATGLVVVSHILASEKSAVGETPNLAARLQQLAQPGEVLVSDRTKVLAAGAFYFEDRGLFTPKGISAPTRVWCALGLSAAPSRFDAATGGLLTPMVGRQMEIALLLDRWNSATCGAGQVVLLCGEPGIGKSRLLRALKQKLGDTFPLQLYQCSPYYTNSALYPFAENLTRRCGFERHENAENKLDKLLTCLPAGLRENSVSGQLLARTLSIPCEQRYGKFALSPQREREEIQKLLVQMIAGQAHANATLLLFEDAHWADPSSREVLEALVQSAQDLPLLVLVTYRPEFNSNWFKLAYVTELLLTRLDASQAAEVVMRVTRSKPLPVDLARLIIEKSDGVPLFLEELSKAVLESDLVKDLGDCYQYSGRAGELTIPATLHDSFMARLDRLIPVKEVAQLGAVLGRQFSYELLRGLSNMPEPQLQAAIQKLLAAELIFPLGEPATQYLFKHALLQDAAYGSLLKSKREALHAQVAQLLESRFPTLAESEPEVLAHHLTEATRYLQAVPYWVRAGECALNRTALAEAVAHLSKALGVNNLLENGREKEQQELRIRMLLGTAYLSFRGHASPEVLHTLEPARDLALRLGDKERLVPILFYLWMHYTARLDFDWGLKIVDQLDSLSRPAEDSYAFVVARNAENMTHGWMGSFQRACYAAGRGVRAYEPKRHAQYVHLYNHDQKCGILSWVVHFKWIMGYPDQAQEAAQEQVDLARQLAHPFNLAFSLTTGCAALIKRGETHFARRWLAEAEEIAREHAIGYMTHFFVPFWTGIVQVTEGSFAEGYARIGAAWKYFEDNGGTLLGPWAAIMKAKALIGMQRSGQARHLLEQALALIHRTGHRMHEAEVYRVLGEANWRAPQPDRPSAAHFFLKALEVARIQEAKGWELRAALSLARMWMEDERNADAYNLLAPIRDWFAEGFATCDLKEADALLPQLQ